MTDSGVPGSRSQRLSIDLTQIDGLKAGLSRGAEDVAKRPEGSVAVDASHAMTPDVLEAVTTDLPKLKAMYATFSPDVLSAYGLITSFVRDSGMFVDPPEVVLVGLKGSGKSSLLEAFLGHPIVHAPGDDSPAPTLRPIVINVIYNASCASGVPRVTIRRDTLAPGVDQTVTLDDLAKLPAEIRARNVPGEIPITITYETRDMMNVTFIDTPGLLPESQPDHLWVDGIVTRLSTSTGEQRTRIALCVQQAGQWPSWIASWAKSVKIPVSFGVYTDARQHLSTLSSPATINKYIAERPPSHASTFFVHLPALGAISQASRFRERMWQADQVLRAAATGVEKRFETSFGVERLRAALLDVFLKSYRQIVPPIRQQHKALKAQTEKDLVAVSQQLQNLTPWKLRGIAMNSVTQFLHMMQSLLEGTIESLPTGYNLSYGQTLEEECKAANGGPWPGPNGMPLHFSPDKWDVPAPMRPLIGRQQFERLLSEFRAVVEHCEMMPLTTDEIVTAAGADKTLANQTNLRWVACDLARVRLERQVSPLVEQFHRRVVYILKRLAETAQAIAKAPKKLSTTRTRVSPAASPGMLSPEMTAEPGGEYPFFSAWMADCYGTYIDTLTGVFSGKCKEEFLPTRIMAWALQRPEKKAPNDMAETLDSVRSIALTVFDQSKTRICRNVLLKCYHVFLDQTQMWGDIQGQINMCLTEEILAELFEIPSTERRIKEEETRLARQREELVKQEGELTSAMTTLGAK